MIQNLIFGVCLLTSDFLAESLKANKNEQKNHLFYNTVSLKKPHSFYQPQLTQHYKNIFPHIFTVKNMFLVGARKKICTAPFLDAQELRSWSPW